MPAGSFPRCGWHLCGNMSDSLLAVPFRHPHRGLAAAYLRRVRRCFWTQSGQRVCPWVALFGQSLHSPSFLRRWRVSRDCTRERSRFSSSVSWGLVGSMAGVRLAEIARVLRLGGVGFVFLRFLRRGITKVDSKVRSLHTPAWTVRRARRASWDVPRPMADTAVRKRSRRGPTPCRRR